METANVVCEPSMPNAKRRLTSAELPGGGMLLMNVRWAMIAILLGMALWGSSALDLTTTKVVMVTLLGLAVVNFFMQAWILAGGAIEQRILALASIVDVVIFARIAPLVAPEASGALIVLYPALLAPALLLPGQATTEITTIAAGLFALFAREHAGLPDDPFFAAALISIAAVAAIGHVRQDIAESRLAHLLVPSRVYSAQINRGERPPASDISGPGRDTEGRIPGAERPSSPQKTIGVYWPAALTTVAARWFLIGTSVALAALLAGNASELGIGIAVAVALMAVNFTLHGRYLVGRPVGAGIVHLASILDLGAIGFIAGFWAAQLHAAPWSGLSALLCPALVGVGLTFRPRVALIYTGLAGGLCVVVGLLASGVGDPMFEQVLIERAIILAATVGVAIAFQRTNDGVDANAPLVKAVRNLGYHRWLTSSAGKSLQ